MASKCVDKIFTFHCEQITTLTPYAPSCQVLQFCQQPVKETSHQYGLVIDTDNSLPLNRWEEQRIKEIYPDDIYQSLVGKEQATVENYLDLATRVSKIYSSHHALSNLKNPLLSFLKLGNGNLTLGEIIKLRLPNLEEIFLSACETNLGLPNVTDDLLTLATGFLVAGVKSVISTLWSVDLLATILLSIFYYEYRKEGNNRPVALRKAQQRLRNLTQGEFERKYLPTMLVFLDTEYQRIIDNLEIKENDNNLESLSHYEKELQKQEKILLEFKEYFREHESEDKELKLWAHPWYWSCFICQGLE